MSDTKVGKMNVSVTHDRRVQLILSSGIGPDGYRTTFCHGTISPEAAKHLAKMLAEAAQDAERDPYIASYSGVM